MRAPGFDYMEIARRGGGIHSSVRDFRDRERGRAVRSSRVPRLRAPRVVRHDDRRGEVAATDSRSTTSSRRCASSAGSPTRLPMRIVPTWLGAHEIPLEHRERRRGARDYLDLLDRRDAPDVVDAGHRALRRRVLRARRLHRRRDPPNSRRAARDAGLGLKLHADELEPVRRRRARRRSSARPRPTISPRSPRRASPRWPRPTPSRRCFRDDALPRQSEAGAGARAHRRRRAVALATDFNPGTSPTANFPLILTLGVSQLRMSARRGDDRGDGQRRGGARAGGRDRADRARLFGRPRALRRRRRARVAVLVRRPSLRRDVECAAKPCHPMRLRNNLNRSFPGVLLPGSVSSRRLAALMSNVAKLKKQAAEFEQKKQFDKALAVYVQILGRDRGSREERRRRAVFNRVGDLFLRQGNADRRRRLLREGGRPLRRRRLLQQRHRALQQDPAPLARPRIDLLQARKDQRAEGLQQRREAELPRVRRPDAEGRQDRRGVSRAEGIRRSLSRSGRHPADARRSARARPARRPKRSSSSRSCTSRSMPRAAPPKPKRRSQRMHSLDPVVEPRRSTDAAPEEAGGLVFLDVGGSPRKPRPKMESATPRGPPPPRPRTPQHVQPLPEFEQLPDIEALGADHPGRRSGASARRSDRAMSSRPST